MQIARVKGNVVSTNKSERLHGLKLLIAVPIDLNTFEEKGSLFVCVDTIGAGEEEVVMIVAGSSARQTPMTDAKPVDSSIVAIVDSIDINGKRVFQKFNTPSGETNEAHD